MNPEGARSILLTVGVRSYLRCFRLFGNGEHGVLRIQNQKEGALNYNCVARIIIMAYMDEISTYLDVENSITVRWLANTLGIDLNKARSSLENYKSTNASVAVSYLVVGTGQHGGLSYIVASESELDDIRSSLKPVRSEELYAIHKVKSVTNKAEMQASEYEQASEILLMSHPNTQDFLSNGGGYITCPSVEVKPLGQRILSASCVAVPVQAKEIIKASVTKAIAEKPMASAASVPAVAKSKSSIQATSFFSAKSTPAPAKSQPVVEAVKVESKPKPEPAVVAEENSVKEAPQKRVGKIAIDDDEDEEWDSGYKPDPKRLKERVEAAGPARAVISTGSEEMDLSDETEDATDAADEGAAAGGKKKGKGKVVKHGAMDDYMEDVAIAEHNHAVANPDAPKPKKRKLVEKVSRSIFVNSASLLFLVALHKGEFSH